MPGKRKDNKGKVLKGGEIQRQNGTYEFRYLDTHGKRRSVYAPTLDELRRKEDQIRRDVADGIDSTEAQISVLGLVDRYLSTKQDVKHGTLVQYNFVVNLLKKYQFSSTKISAVKLSEAKMFLVRLHDDGYSKSSIAAVHSVLRPAFAMAVDDDIIRKNPFDFRLSDIVKNDAVKRSPLTVEQREQFFGFLQTDKVGSRYVDELTILLYTGMRISELCGLTKADVDLKNSRVHVNKQLLRKRLGEDHSFFVESPKTEDGDRFIFLLPEAYKAFQRVLRNRSVPKVEYVVDGYSGFLFLDADGKPKVAWHLEHALARLVQRYNRIYDDNIVLTPHGLRHTFATMLLASGVDIKSAQYLLGHANAQTTLNIYAHSTYDTAARAMERITKADNGAVGVTPNLHQNAGKLREVT